MREDWATTAGAVGGMEVRRMLSPGATLQGFSSWFRHKCSKGSNKFRARLFLPNTYLFSCLG